MELGGSKENAGVQDHPSLSQDHLAQSREKLQEAAPRPAERAKGKQQQRGYWSRAGPYAPALPCSSPKVDSLPQCSGDQQVEKTGFIRQRLGEACGISTNSIRVSISLSHTSGCWRACPVLPPHLLHAPSYFPRSDQECRLYSQIPTDSLSGLLGPHTKLAYFGSGTV